MYIYMYRFTDDKSEKICLKYGLAECLILFEFADIKQL